MVRITPIYKPWIGNLEGDIYNPIRHQRSNHGYWPSTSQPEMGVHIPAYPHWLGQAVYMGVEPKIGGTPPKMDGLPWSTLLKFMIWGENRKTPLFLAQHPHGIRKSINWCRMLFLNCIFEGFCWQITPLNLRAPFVSSLILSWYGSRFMTAASWCFFHAVCVIYDIN